MLTSSGVAAVDFAKCEQPDELIQLAWNAGLDRKAVIREGVDAAGLLLASELNTNITLFWPVPRPLEAVDRWCENPHANPPLGPALRPHASAVVPSCVLGGVVSHFFVAPRMPEGPGLNLAIVGIIAATFAVLGVVFKLLIDATLRRQVARLDEETALGIVLEQLRLGMMRDPRLVPLVCKWIRRGLTPPIPTS